MLMLSAAALQAAWLIRRKWRRHVFEKRQQTEQAGYWQQQIDLLLNAPQQHWAGFKPFKVCQKTVETEEVISFYLKPEDGQALSKFCPGQHLTLQVQPDPSDKALRRCYSLSDSYCPDYYRISVKKEPQGLVSNFLHLHLNEGDSVEVKAPEGKFYLDRYNAYPVVLIAGGIGITPLLSMLNSLAACNDPRETHLFYGVRNGSQVLMKQHLTALSEQWPHFHLYLCYSRPNADDRDYQHQGRIDLELLRTSLPSNNYHFYLCGATSMMQDLSRDLKAWGVPEQDIYFESFGTGFAAKKPLEKESYPVFFSKSNKQLTWTGNDSSLLEFAEDNRIAVEYACRSGQCGMCKTKIGQGDVEYLTEPLVEVEEGSCLTCISIPKAALVLDL